MGEADDPTSVVPDITAPALGQGFTDIAYEEGVHLDVLALSLHNGIGKVHQVIKLGGKVPGIAVPLLAEGTFLPESQELFKVRQQTKLHLSNIGTNKLKPRQGQCRTCGEDVLQYCCTKPELSTRHAV